MYSRSSQNYLFFLLLVPSLAICQKPGKSSRPNIIYIMADDLGYADLSCYGRKDYSTPQLDRLASQGIRFTNAYAAAALCTPTRVAFMTGRYPARHPVGLREPLAWIKSDSLVGLTPDQPNLAGLLKHHHYHTALIGKWHLGFQPAFSPLKNGFDEFFGFHGGGLDYVAHDGPRNSPDLYENERPVKVEGYMTDLLTDRAIEFLIRRHEKPFFLSLQFSAPHWPWQAPGDPAYHDTLPFRAGGSEAVYAAMMKSLDDNIGRILQTLEETELAGNTVVIFVSDNGGERFSDMGPLSGMKAELWEGGIRVPAMIRWPGHIPAGRSSDQPLITMDWTATILALANVKPKKAYAPDGINLMPLLAGQKKLQRTFYWRLSQRSDQKAMREGPWKYLKNEKGEFLFHLEKDPGEKTDLKTDHPELLKRLRKKYKDWESKMLAPVPLQT